MNKSASSNASSHAGYVVEVGGRIDSEYGSITAAQNAGLELKHKNAQAEVKVYDASERIPSPE